MKFSILVFLMILVQNFTFGITEYKPNDELYIWAKSGMNLRAGPSANFNIRAKIPFGEKVICLEYKNYYEYEDRSIIMTETIEIARHSNRVKLKGKFVKVLYGEMEGYIYDAYLSKYQPIKPKRTDYALFDYFKQFEDEFHQIQDIDPAIQVGKKRMVFKNGIFLEESSVEETGIYFKMMIPNFSIEEAFLMIQYFDSHAVKIIQNKNRSIRIEQEVGGYEIKSAEDMILIKGGWGC